MLWSYDAKEEMGTPPVVSNGAVYVMSLQDTLFALDAATGEWKWIHRREPRGIDRGFTIRGAARAVVRGDLVYGAYSDGFVAALEAGTGQVRWERLVAPAGEYTDVDGLFLDGDRLYAAAYSGAVLALDAASGAQIWSFRSPSVSRVVVGHGMVVAVTQSQLLGLSPTTGQPLWSSPMVGAPCATPVFAGRWLLCRPRTAGSTSSSPPPVAPCAPSTREAASPESRASRDGACTSCRTVATLRPRPAVRRLRVVAAVVRRGKGIW